jgi:hypothetical protein
MTSEQQSRISLRMRLRIIAVARRESQRQLLPSGGRPPMLALPGRRRAALQPAESHPALAAIDFTPVHGRYCICERCARLRSRRDAA